MPYQNPLTILLSGKAAWNRWRLAYADVQGYEPDLHVAQLRGIDLHGADLHRADLTEANLRETDLTEANLQEADLRHADLRNANLSGANLWRTNLRGADLRNANLSHANLEGADLNLVDFRGAIFKTPIWRKLFFFILHSSMKYQKSVKWIFISLQPSRAPLSSKATRMAISHSII